MPNDYFLFSQFLGWPANVLIMSSCEAAFLDKNSQHLGSQFLTPLSIAVDVLESLELVTENLLGCRQVLGAVLHLVEGRHFESFLRLLEVHQSWMVAA